MEQDDIMCKGIQHYENEVKNTQHYENEQYVLANCHSEIE